MPRMLRVFVLAIVGVMAAAAAPANAADRLVTYVARSCPSYTDVFANLARNNIQESLRDLGPDTSYVNGQPITPELEEPGQPNCKPLVGWRFTVGDGIAGAVTGTWGSLSFVSSPDPTSIVTKAVTPLLNANGDQTGYALRGAVTVPMTDAQVARVNRYAFWVQGGTVNDPVLDKLYPQRYGFAALRCAIDNLNGDNVESVAYPQGARHVYCYAYYVEPPPTSGTIIVRKVVDDPDVTTAQPFTFEGNISYTEDHTFSLSAAAGQPASETFFRGETRAGEAPWSFREQVPEGWSLTALTCTSATGTSSTTTDLATAAASVTLGAGDTVTCTYADRPTPPRAGLVLSKRTLGGVGKFHFEVNGPANGLRDITTAAEGVEVLAPPLIGTPGRYTITEQAPARTARGRWIPVSATCGAKSYNPLEAVTLTILDGQGAACRFTNRFLPGGKLAINKVTVGGTGTARFTVRRVGGVPRSYDQAATVSRPLVPARAIGDDTSHLPLGTYDIIETGQRVTADGHWRLAAVLCDGRPVGSAQGRAQIVLTAADPRATCTFYDQFVPRPEPSNPTPEPEPTPSPSPEPIPAPLPDAALDAASGPDADLVVTKHVSPQTVQAGQPVTYTVVVRNRGPQIAYDVAVAEVRATGTARLDLHTTQGTCAGDRPARCALRPLRPGESATITATTTAGAPGNTTNRVAAVTSTNDPNLTNNVADAVLSVVAPPTSPRVLGCSSATVRLC